MPVLEALIDPQGRLLRSRGNVRVLRKLPDRMDVECPGQDVSRALVLATAWRPDGSVGTADAAIVVSTRPGLPDQLAIAVGGCYGLTLRIDNDPADPGDDLAADSLPCDGVRTRDWYAWADLLPARPDELHVIGQAEVPNAGVEPLLSARPPGGDPTILLLDFLLLQRPGPWPLATVWKPLRYDRTVTGQKFRRVVVFCGDDIVADLAVDEVR